MSFALDWLAFGSLSGHGVLMLVFTLAVFAAFVTDRLQIGTVCLAVLILLPALFFVFPMQGVEPYRFFGGFGHPALVAICSLMILGRSLVLTGALDPAARQLAWLVARAPWLALLVVLVGAAAMSGFVNDTPLVVLLIPLLATALRRAGRAPAFMLMPMNHAVLIGGMATTIGTSTNVIVVSLAAALGVTLAPSWLSVGAPNYVRLTGIWPTLFLIPALGLDRAAGWLEARADPRRDLVRHAPLALLILAPALHHLTESTLSALAHS